MKKKTNYLHEVWLLLTDVVVSIVLATAVVLVGVWVVMLDLAIRIRNKFRS